MSEETNTNHMAMWDRLQTTPASATKPFKGKGGFSGTAINGMYIQKRLTEEFGPCGAGWRFVMDHEEIVEGHTLKNGDKAKLHKVRGHIEYRIGLAGVIGVDDPWFATSPQFGQTMLVSEDGRGVWTDEEAAKKSTTDCLGKCASSLGIGADIFLGLYDDNKYVNARKQEAAEAATDEAPDPSKHHRAPAPPQTQQAAPEPPKPADKSPPTKAEIEGVKQVYAQVQGLVQGAKTMADIDDTLRANREGLRDLENISPTNFQRLKDFVTQRRKEVDPDPLNDALGPFA